MPHPAHKYMECGTHGSSGQIAPLPVEGETWTGSEPARSHNTEETPARVQRLKLEFYGDAPCPGIRIEANYYLLRTSSSRCIWVSKSRCGFFSVIVQFCELYNNMLLLKIPEDLPVLIDDLIMVNFVWTCWLTFSWRILVGVDSMVRVQRDVWWRFTETIQNVQRGPARRQRLRGRPRTVAVLRREPLSEWVTILM